MPELKDAIAAGRLTPDGVNLFDNGDVKVTKAAVDPCGTCQASRSARHPGERPAPGALRADRRHVPDLVTRPDLRSLPAADRRHDLYFFGDLEARRGRNEGRLPGARRCNGSDVFGSDICTCRPYLAHGIEICIEMAQQGGSGWWSQPQGRQGAWRGHQVPGPQRPQAPGRW